MIQKLIIYLEKLIHILIVFVPPANVQYTSLSKISVTLGSTCRSSRGGKQSDCFHSLVNGKPLPVEAAVEQIPRQVSEHLLPYISEPIGAILSTMTFV